MDLLRLRGVGVGYHGRPILPPVDLAIRRGTFLGVVGPNGSGKTTLLRTILGLQAPVTGRVEHPSGHAPRFGYVPQRSEAERSFPLTALDLVLMGRSPRRAVGLPFGREDRRIALECLRRVGLDAVARRSFHALSGGQRQRVYIARALATEPEVLVLDEPTTGMDIVAEASLLDLIARLRVQDDLGIIMVSHNLSLVAGFVEEVLLVDQERQAVEHGPVLEVVTAARLTALYHNPVIVAEAHGRRQVFVDADACSFDGDEVGS
jgi:ABC-type Mn2+/Zn2+ transport system ATPase subunit